MPLRPADAHPPVGEGVRPVNHPSDLVFVPPVGLLSLLLGLAPGSTAINMHALVENRVPIEHSCDDAEPVGSPLQLLQLPQGVRHVGVLSHVGGRVLERSLEEVEVVPELLQQAFVVVLIEEVRHHLQIDQVGVLPPLVDPRALP